jgi:transcriptional regulator with XRE-family HTH domain
MSDDQAQRTYAMLGPLLRAKRNKEGLTQDDLAVSLDIDRAHVSRIESGFKPVSVSMLLDICTALDADASEVVSDLMNNLRNIT